MLVNKYRVLTIATLLFSALHVTAQGTKEVHYDTFGRVLDGEITDSGSAAIKPVLEPKPHPSMNKQEFDRQYKMNKAQWDKAFAYLKETDLAALKPGRFAIDSGRILVIVTEGIPRLIDTTKWETHRFYADIHCVISGREKIGIAPVSSVKQEGKYDPIRDLTFYTGEGEYYLAEPGTYYVFFPHDAHRPNLQTEGSADKKIVIKVRLSDQ